MPDSKSAFIGDIPKHYDQGLVPYIFADYALEMAGRAANLPASHCLELAAGTGVVTRALRDSLDGAAELVASDLNEPMLAVAAAKFGPDEAVAFHQADAMALPFEDESFDLLVCQFGVMFFPNKVASFQEAMRVLKPGGHYLFSAWGAMEENPFTVVTQSLLEEVFPQDPPSFYRLPFSYHDPARVRDDLARAGFGHVQRETLSLDKEIHDTELFVEGILKGNPVAQEIAEHADHSLSTVANLLTKRLEAAFGRGPGVMPLKAHFYQATKPL